MRARARMLVLVAASTIALGATAIAQEQPLVPIKLQVVISRLQGEKKLSSMPYTLSVNATTTDRGGVATLRTGAKIPVTMFTTPMVGGEKVPASGPIQYQDVGTNIDSFTRILDGGRFQVNIIVDDTSVYADESGRKTEQPSFRSFKASSSMILRDGQTAQFTAATDKVTGEQTRVEVTLTVVK